MALRGESKRRARERGRRAGQSERLAAPRFLFEALEPRLLLSADFNAAAGHILLDGLSALDHSLANLSSTTALTTPVPFINRNVGDIAGLTQFAGLGNGAAADPIAAIRSAAASYLQAHPTSGNLTGLQGALEGLQDAAHPGVTVQAAPVAGASGLPSLGVTITSVSTDANTPGYADSATQTLHLVFGIDQTNSAAPSLMVTSASVGSHNQLTGAHSVAVDLSESWDASASSPIVYNAQRDGFAAATVTPGLSMSPSAPAVTSFSRLTAAAATQAPILPQVSQTFTDLANELNGIETAIENAVAVNFNFPFIGDKLPDALNPHVLMAPIRNEIASIENKIASDFANSGTLLVQVQSDLVGLLSGANLLPGKTPANDVVIKFLTTDAAGVQTVSPSSTFTLEHVTQLELDLILGVQKDYTIPLTADIGLPGLGLKVQPGSVVNASVGFTINLGVGMTASDHYLVSGSSANSGSPINFDVKLYLGSADKPFQAVGTIGFLQALLTEPASADPNTHTGLFGGVGLSLTGVNDGTALNGGVEVLPSHIGNIGAKPTYGLHVQSNLQLTFGADFQKDQTTGDYTDKSDYPSIGAQLAFSWEIGDATLATGATPHALARFSPLAASGALAPTVALNNISVDVGQAITKFIAPILKPVYDVTSPQPVQDLLKFLTSSMDLVPKAAKYLDNAITGGAFHDVFPSYSAGETYDWFDFVVDMAADADVIPKGDAGKISKIGDVIVRVILDMDNAYAAAGSLGGYSLRIPLGNLSFGNKNLALPQFVADAEHDFKNAGDAVVNFANSVGVSQDDLSGYVTDLLGGVDVGSALDSLTGAASDFEAALSDASASVSASTGGVTTTTHTMANIAFPFFEHPDSILGVLFGQNVQFVRADLGFNLGVTGKPGFDFGIPDILTVGLDFPINIVLNLGLTFGYDTKGLTDLIADPSHPEKLLDGFFFGGDPLLKNTKDFADIFNFDANIGAELDASALFGLVSAGIEGSVDFSGHLWLADATTTSPYVHLDQFTNTTNYDVSAGHLGPFDATAQGTISLDIVGKVGWGPFSDSFDYNLARLQFFKWGDPATSAEDAGPLGLYHPTTHEFDLYVGPTASKRHDGDDALIYPTPANPDQILANDSSTYVIDINGDSGAKHNVTIHWYNPATGKWESQTPSGPVSLIVGATGDGANTIIVNNNAPNDVRTHFSGTGGVVYDPNKLGVTDATGGAKGNGVKVGGPDVFEAGGGSTTLEGGDTNNVLVGSANPKSGVTPNNVITGGVGPNLIILNAADAVVQTGSGPTTVYAGAGNQTIHNQKPPVGSAAAQGDDTIKAGPGGSILIPFGPGAEQIAGADGVFIAGGQASKILVNYSGVGAGTSVYGFDGGLNTLDYRGLGSSVNVDLANGVASGPGIGTQAISGFNVVYGAAVGSTIAGGTAAQGSDSIYGQTGVDYLSGGGANDLIVGATPTNLLRGNTISGGAGRDTIQAGDGADSITSGDGANLIHTGKGDDTVTVGNGKNTIFGGVGRQTLTAGDGDNLIEGGDGDDIVLVGFGDNHIYAGKGNYQITAGVGSNYVVGGAGGNDTFTLGALPGGGIGGTRRQHGVRRRGRQRD